jgi:hypothetical protein
MAINGLAKAETGDRALAAQRVFELGNNPHSLYISRNT